MAQRVLSKYADVEVFDVGFENYRKYYYPLSLFRLSRIKGEKDVWIRDYDSVISMPFNRTSSKNVALIHHIDKSIKPTCIQIVATVLEKIFYHNLRKVDAIVTVSEYWQRHFLDRGYTNVYLIYNQVDFSQFDFLEDEVIDFRERHRLDDKPIIYIGNCQRAKGVIESYETLRDMDVHLVTSGRKDVNIPATNLDLNHRDYLKLLAASSVVVTMSKFKEGWCITAHEAMLCKTPVVGSGFGGMRELLGGGGQLICEDFTALRKSVEYLMQHPEVGKEGYEFAKHFTIERFENEWVSCLTQISENTEGV
ncbi:MAG: glycosyltransferase family 4 protein [bacterium]|nr:glycosyltransferase family 4 protein [bacterium]